MAQDILILGSGFTGSRVLVSGLNVTRIGRAQIDFTLPGALAQLEPLITPGCTILHSIPTLPEAADRKLISAFADRPARVVYLSTTAVYGDTPLVDECTPIHPRTPRDLARAETEAAIAAGPWQSLIVRPAAIYGPGRGVHVAIQQGRYTLHGDGANFISRIHVNDLAAIVEAALLSNLTGAYPVADRHPCPSREIAEYCARLLHLPLPGSVPEPPRTNRRVDGSAITRLLHLTLRYPSYRDGIPASL